MIYRLSLLLRGSYVVLFVLVALVIVEPSRFLLLPGIGLLFLALLFIHFGINALSESLSEIHRAVESYGKGDLSYRLSSKGTRATRNIAQGLRRMAVFLSGIIAKAENGSKEQEGVFLSLQEGLVVISAERVVKINAAASEISDIAPEAALGRTIEEVFRNADLLRFVKHALEVKVPVDGDVVLYGQKERYLKVYARALVDDEGRQSTLVVLNDVTQLRRLETVRRDFVANVSHELKTPITSIQGSVETLLEGALEDPEAARTFTEMIGRQAERLNAIFDDLLSLSRIEQETERGFINKSLCLLRPVLEKACGLCSDRAGEGKVELILECPDDLAVPLNESLLQQAVVNLIENAIKYSEVDRPIRITATKSDKDVNITVADEGKGIPASHLARIFERFYRVDQGRGRREGGTGLGLAIVKHICNAHGGSVSAKSEVGKGSKFTISIPLCN